MIHDRYSTRRAAGADVENEDLAMAAAAADAVTAEVLAEDEEGDEMSTPSTGQEGIRALREWRERAPYRWPR